MSQAFSALWASIVRTFVPLVVGFFLQLAVTLNIPLDPEFENLLAGVLTLVFTTLYYVAVRLFETYISPKLGWLLGYAKSPDSYSADMPAKQGQQTTRIVQRRDHGLSTHTSINPIPDDVNKK